MITDRRNRLGSDVIKADECLKSCAKNHLITTDIFDRAMRAIGDLEANALQKELDDYHRNMDIADEDTGDELI